MLHSLKEISHENWIELRNLYSTRRTDPSGYGLIQTIIQWIEKEPTLAIKIYSLDDDWKTDGTFLLLDFDMETPHIYFNTLATDSQSLNRALHLLNFKSNLFFNTLLKGHVPILKQILFEKGVDFNEVKYFDGNWFHLSQEEALKFNISPSADITLSKLMQKHAEQINNLWPHKGAGTIKYIQKLIRLNESVGAFDLNKNLVAWCLRTPSGALGNVQVLESHRRLGLGSLVVRYMSKNLALKNEEIMAAAKYDNMASRSLFEKLGFKAINEAFCMEIPNVLSRDFVFGKKNS